MKFRDGVNLSEQKLFFVDLIIESSLTPQELFTLYIARVLLLYPAHLCIQRLGGELGKHCTKDRVPGEWLTNNEQRAGELGGERREEGKERGDSLSHTHTLADGSKRRCGMPTLFTHLAFSLKASHKPSAIMSYCSGNLTHPSVKRSWC